jgi:hypothetical protein
MTDIPIDFLDQLGGDLRLAAARETVARSRPTHPAAHGRGGRPTRRWLKLGAAAAAFLTVAGIVGTQVTGGGGLGSSSLDAASEGGAVRPQVGAVPAPAEEEGLEAGYSAGVERDALGVDAGAAASDQAATGTTEPIPGAQGVPGEISKVIETADLSIEVPRDSFAERFQRASQIAEELGGYVTTQSAGVRSGSLVMRIPAKYFNRARGLLKELGVKTVRDGITGTDVTAEFVDTKARIEILQARREALTTLLRDANSLTEILRLENAIDDVLIRIEEAKGRVRLINDQTSKATIAVELHEEGVAPTDDDRSGIVDAWSSSIEGFLSVVGAILVGIGYLLPIVLLAGLGWVVVRAGRRRTAERG